MVLVYWFLALTASSISLVMLSVSTVFALFSLAMAIVFVIFMMHCLFKDGDKEELFALFNDIIKRQDLLYETEKGKITYEIDKESIAIHVHAKSFTEPVLSFVYNKRNGSLAVSKRNAHLTHVHVEKIKQLIEGKKTDRTATTTTIITLRNEKDLFLQRLQKMEIFRKELLQEEARLDIEIVHLLEQTLPQDLLRIETLYRESKEENKGALFSPLLQPLEEKLNQIQDDLARQNENAFDQLEALLFTRYKMK